MRRPATAGLLLILVLALAAGSASAGSLAAGTSASELLDQGNTAFSKLDYTGAILWYSRLLKEYPDDKLAVTAAFLRGVSQYQAGQASTALDSFQKLDRTWPLNDFRNRLPYWKGVSALGAGLLGVAERELTAQARLTEAQPWATRALFHLGLTRLQAKQEVQAVEAFTTFLGKSTEGELRARACYQLGRAAQRQAAPEALEWYRKASLEAPGSEADLQARKSRIDLILSASGNSGAALGLVNEGSAAFPADRDFWETRRIEAARKAGDITVLRLALLTRLGHETNPLAKQKLAVNLAVLADEVGTPDVRLWADAALGPDPDLSSTATRRQAALLEAAGSWTAAARLLASRPEQEDWLSRASQDFQAAGDTAAFLDTLGQLIKRYPSSVNLANWLDARAGLLLPAGDSAGALRDLDRILKDFPRYARVFEVRYQMGLVYLQRNEPLRAEAWFYGLITELGSGELYQRALLARGQCYANAGKNDLARGTLERLLRESPGGPWAADAWFAVARTQLQDRNFPAAWEAYSQAAGKYPLSAQPAVMWEGLAALALAPDASKASSAYLEFASRFASDELAGEAVYRAGAVLFQAKDARSALELWTKALPAQKGKPRDEIRVGMALALASTGDTAAARASLEKLESESSDGEFAANAWFQLGQSATALGQGTEATAAFETLIRLHPNSSLVEKALPRAAGALLSTGDPSLALARYADFFSRFGQQTSSVAVARSATAASALYPDLLEKLVGSSRSWSLAPEVKTEFDLAWWKSQLDIDAANALTELQNLSRNAPWTSQRSQALYIAGQWSLSRGRTDDARAYFEAAQALGDDLSVFRARLGLAQVAEKEGRPSDAARQKETAERSAGPGVPQEFRVAALQEARDLWKSAGKEEDLARVSARLDSFTKSP